MIVVDASALLEALLRTPAARAVEERLFEPRQTLHAPHLLDIEVAQVIRWCAVKAIIQNRIGMNVPDRRLAQAGRRTAEGRRIARRAAA